MHIRPAVIERIIEHAVSEAPLECCGLLLGVDDTIEDFHRARNVRQSPVAFQVEPADHFDAIRSARRRGMEVLGAYHSHPHSPSVPSPTDVRESQDPTLLHVIVSLAGPTPDLSAYRIANGNFMSVELVPTA